MKKKISELRVAELRSELEKRGLDSKGLKGALVQRLQKALEEESDDTNELEISSDFGTPKSTSRRSVGRSKKAIESETEENQANVTINAKAEEANVVIKPLQERNDDSAEGEIEESGDRENGVNQIESIQDAGDGEDDNPEVAKEKEQPGSDDGMDDARDVTPTRDEEEDVDETELYHAPDDEPPVEEDHEMYEDNGDYCDEMQAEGDYEEEAGNDFQNEEDDPEYRVEEEAEDEDVGGDEGQMVTVEEEMADHEESGAGDAVGEETPQDEGNDTEMEAPQTPQEDPLKHEEHVEDDRSNGVSLEMNEEKTTDSDNGKPADEKPDAQVKGEHSGKEEVVSSEVDVLDMLDYDLELTGEQTNINPQNDDPANKTVANRKPRGDSIGNTECGPSAASDDHKAHPKPDSSTPSSSESQKAGSQSSSKSESTSSSKALVVKRDGAGTAVDENMNRNLWISGLSSTTRASELKSAFSRYGKAKGDPSASSKKSSSKKDAEARDSSKSKDADSNVSSSSSRRHSAAQSAKDDERKDGQDSKKSHDGKPTTAIRRVGDGERPSGGKSPTRSRAERGSTSTTPRAGEKRHNRSPAHSRSSSNRNEPERKRARPLDSAADRKVVIDSNKGELRVNVSRTSGRMPGGARWEGNQKPKPLLSRRRSASPLRRRSYSPLRTNIGGGRGRGRGGHIRSSGTYEDRTVTRPRRDAPVLTMSQIRAQQRDRVRVLDRGGRGGLSRIDLSVDRERLRREREERERLRIERERLERERRQLEKDRQERERLESERLRLEQERKRELERIEREKAEMRRLQEITRYEVEQRQRAIKRTFDDDRGGRSSRDGMTMKRPGGRPDPRRERDDNRRGYNTFNARNQGQRNGPSNEPPPPGTEYRSRQQGTFRDSSSSKPSTYHDARGRPQDRDDSRYGNRNADKYDRRPGADEGGRSSEYQSQNYDGHRRGPPRDGRKVVRERPNERGDSSPEYRRPSGGRTGTTARIELTREQSPPVRRIRRDSSPTQTNPRGTNWRDSGKSSRDSSRRGDDRDLREQLRGSRQDNYSDSSRNTRRGSRSPNRSASQYSSARWPDSSSSASQAYTSGSSGSAIPTTGRGSGNTNWNQQWQQNVWSGATIQTASGVGRQVIPPYGAVPSASTIITPGSSLIPATQGGYAASGSDRQSRSFQGSSYKQPIQRRF